MPQIGAEYILTTSCKGGVGKSTCAVNTAFAAAKAGRRVLLCDFNPDMRCLDLMLGVEDEVVYDLYDAAKGKASLSKSIIRPERRDGLCLLAAPYSGGGELTSDELRRVFESVADEGFDFVLIDTAGTMVSPELLATGLISTALIVASHQPSSIRAADATGEYLMRRGVTNQRLIINSFDFDGALSGARPGINEIIDRTCITLGGIVPYDRELMLLSETGRLAADSDRCRNSARAFENIARRLTGQYIPLFDGFAGMGVRRRIKRLLRQN